MNKDFLFPLGISPKHFYNGVANFDAVDYYHLSQACGSGCKLKLTPNTSRITNILFEFSELMCFGKVSIDGEITLIGITGFPGDDTCVRYLRDISASANKKKISNNYVFIEW